MEGLILLFPPVDLTSLVAIVDGNSFFNKSFNHLVTDLERKR